MHTETEEPVVAAKPMKDFAPGELMFTVERMGDDKNNMEVREVFFRREDGPTRYPENVRVARLGIVQGDPYDTESERPRFSRWGRPDHTEADGRTLANGPGLGGSAWAARFPEPLGKN